MCIAQWSLFRAWRMIVGRGGSPCCEKALSLSTGASPLSPILGDWSTCGRGVTSPSVSPRTCCNYLHMSCLRRLLATFRVFSCCHPIFGGLVYTFVAHVASTRGHTGGRSILEIFTIGNLKQRPRVKSARELSSASTEKCAPQRRRQAVLSPRLLIVCAPTKLMLSRRNKRNTTIFARESEMHEPDNRFDIDGNQ